MKIALVYKTGGDYTAAHVARLVKQIREVGRLADSIMLYTDAAVEELAALQIDAYFVALRRGYAGWWTKMELMDPSQLPGDLLYMDLDTTILGPLVDIASVGQLALARANRRENGKHGLQSALMYLPFEARCEAWAEWHRQGEMRCTKHFPGGDDRFLETIWFDKAARYQDLVPGQIQRYKKELKRSHVAPRGTRLVIFCKRPRPWEVPEIQEAP